MPIGKLSKFLKAKMDRAWPGETVDPTPMAPPIGYKKQPTIWEQQRALIRSEMSRHAAEQGMETFEESDDFEIGDDYDPNSPYESDFDPPTEKVVEAFSPPKAAAAEPPPPPQPVPAPATPVPPGQPLKPA